MSAIGSMYRPSWLKDSDELPHAPDDVPLWTENYLPYLWAPGAGVGIYFHMCHTPGPPDLWEAQFVAALPGDMFLMSKCFAPFASDDGPVAGGVRMRCIRPYEEWYLGFCGGARLVSGEELRAGPLRDGEHVHVECDITTIAMSPPYDFGNEHLDQPWGHGHYEQHYTTTGRLRFGDQEYDLTGTGMRDHSWGPRDWKLIGNTTWLHGQFPTSGRSFMAVEVTGVPPAEPFRYAVVSDGTGIEPVTIEVYPEAKTVETSYGGYELTLHSSRGLETIRCEILAPIRMCFLNESEIAMGAHQPPIANHDYVEALSRFDWDGETGYGLSERTSEL